MKEITAIIRMNMINSTKEALSKNGFPAITCRKVMGRGKKKVDFYIINTDIESELIDDKGLAEQLSEAHRLIPKRLVTILVDDADVKKIVDIIIEVNHTGNPGDGKIFVTNVIDAARVRTGETGTVAI